MYSIPVYIVGSGSFNSLSNYPSTKRSCGVCIPHRSYVIPCKRGPVAHASLISVFNVDVQSSVSVCVLCCDFNKKLKVSVRSCSPLVSFSAQSIRWYDTTTGDEDGIASLS